MPKKRYSGEISGVRSTATQRWLVAVLMVSPILLFVSYWGKLAYQAAQKRSAGGTERLQAADTQPAPAPSAGSWDELKAELATLSLPEQEERLWAFVNGQPSAEAKSQALRVLGEVQLDLLYTTHQGPGKRGHLVEQGQSLAQIAQKYGSTIPAIVRTNNLLGTNVQPGQHLVVPELGTVEAHVYLQGRRLVLYWQGKFLKDYSISLPEKPGAAITGEGKVASKSAVHAGKAVQIGEPEYYLAEKVVKMNWGNVELAAPADPAAGAEEGNVIQASTAASRVLMASKEDLEEIFPLLTSATRVIIRD